jgi:hypothetical protein
MPQLNHAADSPLRALALVSQTATRLCAEAMQNVWRWCGALQARAHGGVLQRGARLPVGVVPAPVRKRRVDAGSAGRPLLVECGDRDVRPAQGVEVKQHGL